MVSDKRHMCMFLKVWACTVRTHILLQINKMIYYKKQLLTSLYYAIPLTRSLFLIFLVLLNVKHLYISGNT